ncbi:MAG: hypothetical protein HRU15_03050 [Planctomycetes bacterium]|nr:hypothetical protein [Planctomycetota bacterium]
MQKISSLILLILLCAYSDNSLPGEENTLSKKAQQRLNSYNDQVDKILSTAQIKLESIKNEIIQDLEKEKKASTKKGELKQALAIQAKIDELQSSRPASDLFGTRVEEAVNERNIVGKWLCDHNGTFTVREFSADKSFAFYESDAKATLIKKKWSSIYTISDNGMVEVRHPKKKKQTHLFTLKLDGRLFIKIGVTEFYGRKLK